MAERKFYFCWGIGKMSEWIKCSNKMPEKDGRYLVFEFHSFHSWIGVCSLRHGVWDIAAVTHWMHLPEKPQ